MWPDPDVKMMLSLVGEKLALYTSAEKALALRMTAYSFQFHTVIVKSGSPPTLTKF
jgi:hypothetical protein